MHIERRVYLDNNATTPVDERVVDYMLRFFREDYAIASSQFSHTPGIMAKKALDKAREILAGVIGAYSEEIIFTSGGTESNNLAILGVVRRNESGRKKMITSSIEHFSVLHTVKYLEKNGYKVEFVRVDEEGFLDLEHLKVLVDDDTLLVSVIHGNHEVGTVQDIKTIGEIVHSKGALFHVDASASFLRVPIDVRDLEVDLISFSAHKVYGPKGVGALFVRKNTPIAKIMFGGYNEFDLRPGTENIPAIAGFGKAVEIFSDDDVKAEENVRDYLYSKILESVDGVYLNGASDFSKRLSNNLNVSFEFIEGESVVLHLDMRGIAVITGSACFSRALQASHILLAMGFSHERAHGSIRFSPSKYTGYEDIDYTVSHLKEVVSKLRELSPLAAMKK